MENREEDLKEIEDLISLAEKISSEYSLYEKRVDDLQMKIFSFVSFFLVTILVLVYIFDQYFDSLEYFPVFIIFLFSFISLCVYFIFSIYKSYVSGKRALAAERHNLSSILSIVSDFQSTPAYYSLSGVQKAIFETRLNRIRFN